jgi:hypothetical protein
VKRQASLPLSIFEMLYKNNKDPLAKAIGELTGGALFFAMRSCEYSDTTGPEKKTKILTVGDIKFYRKGIITRNNRTKADTVKITFQTQKNGVKMQPILRSRGKESDILCPVRIWANIVDRILSYKNTSEKSQVNTVEIKNRLHYINSDTVRKRIRTAVELFGEKRLGFTASDVGTHSIRTSFATMLNLEKEDPLTIQAQGRWKSAAFMDYIRRDVIVHGLTTKITAKSNRNIKKLK